MIEDSETIVDPLAASHKVSYFNTIRRDSREKRYRLGISEDLKQGDRLNDMTENRSFRENSIGAGSDQTVKMQEGTTGMTRPQNIDRYPTLAERAGKVVGRLTSDPDVSPTRVGTITHTMQLIDGKPQNWKDVMMKAAADSKMKGQSTERKYISIEREGEKTIPTRLEQKHGSTPLLPDYSKTFNIGYDMSQKLKNEPGPVTTTGRMEEAGKRTTVGLTSYRKHGENVS